MSFPGIPSGLQHQTHPSYVFKVVKLLAIHTGIRFREALANICRYHIAFLKSSRPSLPLKKAPPLTPPLSPQERGRKPPSGARNRYAIRLADHQRSRHIMRDGTALLRCFLYQILSLIYMNQQKECRKHVYYDFHIIISSFVWLHTPNSLQDS